MADTKIRAGVELTLQDLFSTGMRRAGGEAKTFSAGLGSAAERANSALSGLNSKMAGIGLGIGAGLAVNKVIDYNDRITRLGTNMNLSVQDTEKLKNSLIDVAGDHHIKLSPDGLTAAVEQIGELTGDAKFATENLRTLGLVMQATGSSGEAIGGMAAELQKMKLAPQEVAQALGTLAAQGKAGAFTIKNFAEMGPRLYSAYAAAGRTGVAASAELGAVMQIIRQGTGTSEQAGTAFEAMMRNLTDPVKQKQLRQMGIEVRDGLTGQFRSVTELIPEIVTKGKSLEKLGTIFDSEAIRAFNSSLAEFQATGSVKGIEQFTKIVGGLPDIEADAARNSATLKSNITGLQTAFGKFADNNLTTPLGALTDLLNGLAEKPKEVQKAFTMIGIGIAGIAALKGFSAVRGLIADMKGAKVGGAAFGGLGVGTKAGVQQVMVMNWPAGMGAGGTPPSGSYYKDGKKRGIRTGGPGLGNEVPTATPPKTKGGALKAGLAGAGTAAAIGLFSVGIDVAQTLSDKEATANDKSKAIGGSVGSAVGGIGGAAGGAALGALIGTATVPVVGTIVGALLGAGLGLVGSWVGGEIGKGAGDMLVPEAKPTLPANAPMYANPYGSLVDRSDLSKSALPQPPQLQMPADPRLQVAVTVDDKSTRVAYGPSRGSGWEVNTGSQTVARALQ